MLRITFTESHSPNLIHRTAFTELKFEDLSRGAEGAHTHTHTPHKSVKSTQFIKLKLGKIITPKSDTKNLIKTNS